MPVPDYDKTLVGRYIRAIENPDSIGFKNGRWYQSSRRGDDPNNRGFGIDVKYNKDAVKQTRGRKGLWLSEEEERALRNKHIDYSLGVVDRNTPKILKQPPSENKRAVAAGLIYRGDGKKTIIDNPTLRDTYYTGTDEDFQKAVADYYKQKGITERARKHSEFLKTNVSKPEEKPSWESFGKFTQRTFSDGGPLTAYKSWEDLSMREKAEMMKVAVRNGITDLGSIKAEYNEFAKGGPKSTGISGNAQKAMSYFMGKGLSRDQAAGLVGNLMRESTLNPTAVNKGSGAYGLAQWLGSRKKALFARYGNAPTFDQQLDFIWHELNTTHKNGLRHLKNSKSFSDAASNAFGYYEFSAGPQGAVQAMNRSRQDGMGALNKGIRFASQLMGQPVPKQAWHKGTGNVQMPEMAAEIPVPEVEFMPSNPEVFFGYNDQGGSPVYPVSYQQPFITFDELPASATEAQKVDIRKLEEQERKRDLYNMMGFLGKMYGSLDNGNSKGETNIFDAIGNLTGYKPFHEFRKGGKKEGITDEEYYNRMERVAQENYRQWGFDSPTDALVHALNDNTYDYRGFYNENPDSSADADTHWPDTYKTVWHPTFSRESKYSGKMSDYNPKGLEGGSWIGDTFIPSWWQRDVKAMGGNLFGDGGETKAGMPVTYYPAEDVMPVVADNMDKSIVLDDVVVTPSRKIPMQSDLFEGVTNQAANERADEFANRTSLTPGRFLGLMGANVPLAAGALGATVAAPAVFNSTIAPLSDYVAGTKAGQAITGLLGNPYFNTAVEAGFAGHGLDHAVNEGIDGWGDAALTALEIAPLFQVARPATKYFDTVAIPSIENFVSEHPTLYQYPRYAIGKFKYGFDAELPTLYRKFKDLPKVENSRVIISNPNNRFAFNNGFGEESPIITNMTTDVPVRSHGLGDWDRDLTLAFPGKTLLGKKVISTRPSDTFAYEDIISVPVKNIVGFTGRPKEITFLQNSGIRSVTSPEAEVFWESGAGDLSKQIGRWRAEHARRIGHKRINLGKNTEPSGDFRNYATTIENLTRETFKSPTMKDYEFMDYVFRPRYSSQVIPKTDAFTFKFLDEHPLFGGWIGSTERRRYLEQPWRWNTVMYDPLTAAENEFRSSLNIGLKPEYKK